MPPPLDVAAFGQVFTPPAIVQAMLALRRRAGRVLEPSAGDGAFARLLPDCVAIEVDARHAPPGSLCMDFFDYPESERFHTIIGNPPYVRFQDIRPTTARRLNSTLFDGRSNLYLFFIEKAVRHLEPGGELIFITPRDFLKATSAVRLNRWLFEQGTITDAVDLGDARVFAGAVPNCLIWRFEKGNFSRQTRHATLGINGNADFLLANPPWTTLHFSEVGGHLLFSDSRQAVSLGQLFEVKVGGVSGADKLFLGSGHGTREFVYSATQKTGKTRSMIWQAPGDPAIHPALLPHKAALMARRIRHFDESNWWQWGRGYPQTDAPRLYVNHKTRQPRPFFLHPCPHFDGAVLALFPQPGVTAPLETLRDALNAVDWAELGFVCDGRFIFTQRSLAHAPLPDNFRRYLPAAV